MMKSVTRCTMKTLFSITLLSLRVTVQLITYLIYVCPKSAFILQHAASITH